MAATKRQFNWGPVTFTPSGGSLTTATGVTGVNIDGGGSLAKFSGDGDRFPTTVVNDFNDPTITVTLADTIWAMAIPIGTRGTLVCVHKDAKAAVGGAITFTLINAICASNNAGGQHRQFGQTTIMFSAESADGTTNPLSSAAA